VSLIIEGLKEDLRSHHLYRELDDVASLRVFMENHVVAVWDFMSLVKSLQAAICGSGLPWVPPADPKAARLINEIVLGEETDQIAPGVFKSHFELYVDAMRQVGCDMQKVEVLVRIARLGESELSESRLASVIGAGPARFVRSTFGVFRQPVHVQAAVFFHSRENLIPGMFMQMIEQLTAHGHDCGILIDYLERHVNTDGEIHGPMAKELLDRLYDGREECRRESEAGSIEALNARRDLWDWTLHQIREGKAALMEGKMTRAAV
jgi:hypothetical protein